MKAAAGVGALVVGVAVALLMGFASLTAALVGSGQNVASATERLPPLARDLLPDIERLTANACPELPVVWVLAEVQAESSWNPHAFRPDRNGGSAGLYQLNEQNWIAAGGRRWRANPPPEDADVLQPVAHLSLAIPWICGNLRTVAEHLAETGKPTSPLDAMLVCHIAGCGRVLESRTGVPEAGEARCDASCARLVQDYVGRVHELVETFMAQGSGPVSLAGLRSPSPFTDDSAGCTVDDPSSRGCLTPRTRHVYDELVATFGPPGANNSLRSITCWDPHPQNPRSDHPRGKACDVFPARPGTFPTGVDLRAGWAMATWLRSYADALGIHYLIWQGRYWDPSSGDDAGSWGVPYTGGGIYDPTDATGGHFDHVHISVR